MANNGRQHWNQDQFWVDLEGNELDLTGMSQEQLIRAIWAMFKLAEQAQDQWVYRTRLWSGVVKQLRTNL